MFCLAPMLVLLTVVSQQSFLLLSYCSGFEYISCTCYCTNCYCSHSVCVCLIHVKFDSTGDTGAIGAHGARHDGCYCAEQAAVQTLHGKCRNIL